MVSNSERLGRIPGPLKYSATERKIWEALAQKGMSAYAISQERRAGTDTVTTHLKRVGLFKRQYRSKLSTDKKELICQRYAAGEGATSLARAFGVDKSAVYYVLNKAGIGTRPRSNRKNGPLEIRNNVGIRKSSKCWGAQKSDIRHYAFDTLNEDACYWAGFIASDGSVGDYSHGSARITIRCNILDAEHLNSFYRFIGSSKSVKTYASKNGYAGVVGSAVVSVSSDHLFDRLQELGIVPKKGSQGITIHKDLSHSSHFWRGVWDGDGSLSASIPYLSGVPSLLQDWERFARSQGLDVHEIKQTGTTSISRVKSSIQSLTAILGYTENVIALPRKKLCALRRASPYVANPINKITEPKKHSIIIDDEEIEGLVYTGKNKRFVVTIDPNRHNEDVLRTSLAPALFWKKVQEIASQQDLYLSLKMPHDSQTGWEDILHHETMPALYKKGARSLSILKADKVIAQPFLDVHHIQGYRQGLHIALVDDVTPRALMSFGSPQDCRSSIGDPKSYLLLARFAVAGHVPGAASRLLAAGIALRPQRDVITFSDRRYTLGSLYTALGFQKDREIAPSYVYWLNGRIIHKNRAQKHHLQALGGHGDTESQLARSLGAHRIWDLGKDRWILSTKKARA